ncbi:hypothetical protein [Burkholderia multivorans]|uniref:hypothetical protein n=1 Tax=Burkholderia multivorans TaxID=87883 RepID=UPI001C239C07|nr:hypothetical protein [Burkholderia multivorans]MBU9386619.1 hypothetical protein [Burkholderia multivorans]MBU9437053.1 hypothetical protein [Burkholderia multivorans]MBU9606258.1 hypothetical protein [Burkholderia multivorans]MBU9624817.1 hypothetical protein [Burkholderia multivorans]
MKKTIFVLALLLAACGGDSEGPGGSLTIPNATHGGQVVPLRACETTGPDAPPCPASEAAGGQHA